MKLKLFKICIVGDGGVGKTTLLHRYIDGRFIQNTMMTIGTNFFLKEINIDDYDSSVRLQIWDLGGQEHFAPIRPSFYAGASGIIYAFDLTRLPSLYNLRDWKEEVKRGLFKQVPCILIGNKLDLIGKSSDKGIEKDIEEIKLVLNTDYYFETSAKTNIGIEQVFQHIAKEIIDSFEEKE